MPEVKDAAFRFTDYEVSEFMFKSPDPVGELKLGIDIKPLGEYDENNSLFTMTLHVKCTLHGQGDEFVKLKFVARFNFIEAVTFQNIPDVFYQNSLGIVFPYIRAFLSTLTLQANVGSLNLPLINLTGIVDEFRANSKLLPEETKK